MFTYKVAKSVLYMSIGFIDSQFNTLCWPIGHILSQFNLLVYRHLLVYTLDLPAAVGVGKMTQPWSSVIGA